MSTQTQLHAVVPPAELHHESALRPLFSLLKGGCEKAEARLGVVGILVGEVVLIAMVVLMVHLIFRFS